jgi:hypothetical protein
MLGARQSFDCPAEKLVVLATVMDMASLAASAVRLVESMVVDLDRQATSHQPAADNYQRR